ncbi:hypothetical protein BKA62DRAFT_183841 [Auriculariales sp. MPI-PUGE-AT-0066]|nr:hypothetical protein BKA62DRAFT_183841 [Auriculariales sp. MPI-PUGE-AT-0066]
MQFFTLMAIALAAATSAVAFEDSVRDPAAVAAWQLENGGADAALDIVDTTSFDEPRSNISEVASRDDGDDEDAEDYVEDDDETGGPADGASLVKRACKKSKCNCIGLKKGAIFCGDGVLGCKKGNVYQCNSNGKTTCNFGTRSTCKKCNKLKC